GDPASLAREFSGLLLTGGGDVEPARYGGARLPTDTVDVDRDREEFALLDAFLRQGRPVFGICRGVQLLNVYFGGTLCQQVPGHADGARHTVHAVPGSRIEALCGAAFETNSWHHQAADALAPGLRCTASSPDGLAEALEHEAFPIFGVQWHPERMLPGLCADVDTDHQCLFDDFIKECGAHHE
ncbi:gamma-glutamyl-gamma-aminobutyrate hydrolase family protein, partial [Clostridiaceae bacterium]|nr:gamma-glutamyl-gamma-aminobutyrate hydrolase family protein [Clostridiaceae bacterium]